MDVGTTRIKDLNMTTPLFFFSFLYVSLLFPLAANWLVADNRKKSCQDFLKFSTRRQRLTIFLNYISRNSKNNSDDTV